MAKIQFPGPEHSPFTDANGQVWEWNGIAWVRKGTGPGIEEAPEDNQQYSRMNADWVLTAADQWYLGAHPEAPINDGYGGPLIPGHTYYNTQTATVYVWDGGEWDAFSGVSEIATLSEFRWDSLNLTAGTPLDVNLGDEHGNYPVDPWEEGLIIVNVYKNGNRLIEQRTTDGTDQGAWDPASGAFPGANVVTIWDWWTVSADGSYGGQDFVTGEVLQAIVTNASSTVYENNWRTLPSGSGLDSYDYTVEYSDGSEGSGQRVTFMADITAGDRLVIETGTLAASEYVKTTFENACGWSWVNCGVLDPNNTAKVPVEKTVADYVQKIIEESGLGHDVRIGEIFDFAGPPENVPEHAVICNGQELSKADYPKLYAAIGDTWSNWRGQTVSSDRFRVPPQSVDVGGQVQALHFAGSTGDDVGTYKIPQNMSHKHGNDHTHTGSMSNAGAHSHNLLWVKAAGTLPVAHNVAWDNRYNGVWAGGKVSTAGSHNHSLTIHGSQQDTGYSGGKVTRPPTAIILKCIWADRISTEPTE
jgi:hypothetical protein